MAEDLKKEETPPSASDENAANGKSGPESPSAQEDKGQAKEKKSLGAMMKSTWAKTGLDIPTLITMAKYVAS